ncbi:phenylacetate--CoA ligase family protein [Paenibacillus alkalitolerans]|uniref:CoF synthetase n=1 Tax=Paenibacillus alkalitolerans TaxID=2799335 RepID=UPI001F1E3AC5|nr:CoF synthetase [Paenibacillus alkalitolerans]
MLINNELSDQIRRTANIFNWYAEMIEPLRNGVERGLPLELEQLPLMTSRLLEKHYYSGDDPLGPRAGLSRYRTSGTSANRRKSIYYSKQDEERYIRIKTEVFADILRGFQARKAMADMGTGHAAATAETVFRTLGLEVETVSYTLPIERHLERLAAFRPDVLYTMPSILDRILMASPDPSVYGIRKVILVGEAASLSWLGQAAERLGLAPGDITDTYGSIEVGTIARYDHDLGRYLFTDGIFAEGLTAREAGEDEEHLAEDERVLVLTSTVRDMFPVIRFVTYDVVRDFRPVIVNGEPRQSFRSIVRRIGSELKHGEKISIYDIENAVYRHIRNASIMVSAADNALTVQIFGDSATEEALRAIRCDVADRIPEIGVMIRNGMLRDIRVVACPFDDSVNRSAVKLKKIYRE